jgi:hypothetical protein
MPRTNNYQIMDRILDVLVRNIDNGLNKRQVAHRVGGKYSTVFQYLEVLQEYGLITLTDFRTEKGTRPYVIVKLGLLGYLYAIYKNSLGRLVLSKENKEKLIEKAFHELLNFFNQKSDTLCELFDSDSWNKLCFNAFRLIKGREGAFKITGEIMFEVANSIFWKYSLEDHHLECLNKILRNDTEILNAIFEGIKAAHINIIFRTGFLSLEEKDYLEAFGTAFNSLAEEEKMDVMAGFRYEYNSLLRRMIKRCRKDIPKEILDECYKMMGEAGLNQIVCLFWCPKCGYKGPSVQELEKLLGLYVVKCRKCNGAISMAHLPKYYDKEAIRDFNKWVEGVALKQMLRPISDAYVKLGLEAPKNSVNAVSS